MRAPEKQEQQRIGAILPSRAQNDRQNSWIKAKVADNKHCAV